MAQSKAKIAANARYNKKTYERIAFDLRKDEALNADCIRKHAESRCESVNSFLKRAVSETIQRDNESSAE